MQGVLAWEVSLTIPKWSKRQEKKPFSSPVVSRLAPFSPLPAIRHWPSERAASWSRRTSSKSCSHSTTSAPKPDVDARPLDGGPRRLDPKRLPTSSVPGETRSAGPWTVKEQRPNQPNQAGCGIRLGGATKWHQSHRCSAGSRTAMTQVLAILALLGLRKKEASSAVPEVIVFFCSWLEKHRFYAFWRCLCSLNGFGSGNGKMLFQTRSPFPTLGMGRCFSSTT